ncbi:hypothetical protein Thiofri_00974 [Thiorhodovibrio frisius]|nr:hypothetical protein Thiofri_00974 [Thiorhodovibrio frisius]
MAGALGDDLRGLGVHHLPVFVATHHMDLKELLAIGSILVANRVDPLKLLLALAPCLFAAMLRVLVRQAAILLPDSGQRAILEHDHKIPVIAAAAFHDRAIGIKPIEQHHHRQTGKGVFDALGQAVEGLGLAILFALLALLWRILEELAH